MKSMHTVFRMAFVSAALLTLATISGCDEAPTEPGSDPDNTTLELSAPAAGLAVLGWQAMNDVTTQEQFSMLGSGEDGLFEDAPGMINSLAEVQAEAVRAVRTQRFAEASPSLAKTSADSLIWSQEWDDPISGTAGRRALYYDAQSGNGRVYEVIYKFPPQVRIAYDSSEIRVYIGPTLLDSTDDRLLGVDKLTRFREEFIIEQVHSSVEATDWDNGNEVIGATALNIVNYSSSIELMKLTQEARFNPDDSGTVAEIFDFRDNTSRQRSISFFPDHTGTFSETWRNGTTVSGTFEDFEDDNHGALTRTIQFANNPWLEKIADIAEFTLDPADSSSMGLLSRKLYFRNGRIDSTRIESARRYVDGYWQESLDIRTANDGNTLITVIHKDSYDEFSGEHFGQAGFYARFNGLAYADGSGEIWLNVYASKSAYDDGEAPILTAHYVYQPDGSGSGDITENNTTYTVEFSENGEIEVAGDDGKSTVLNGYE